MSRAASPLIGTVLLAGVTVVLAAVVVTVALGVVSPPDPADPVVVSASASADGRIHLVHEAGSTLDVAELSVRVAVDDTPLEHQPPVPFFSAAGFYSGPSGPFNSATDPGWESGERAGFRVAGTNSPPLEPGSTVTVRIFRDGTPLVAVDTRVE